MKGKEKDRFWERIPMQELSEKQWESLCDGCCKCCAYKLQDEDTEEMVFTNVVCKYLDLEAGRCTVYDERQKYVPDCIKVTPQNATELEWMPNTCAYKLVANGEPLPLWHPLETGDPRSTMLSGNSAVGKVISEDTIDLDDIEDYVVSDDYFEQVHKTD
ncbi:YcgN family cysteine cluster protein [Aliikangiella maris]|uniref:YcgN family cysteine cluster protein n=2 Tax=Aliikangiella maris TaxID=3162458 RepID=A0ABV3ML07_9GAMM